MSRVGPVLCPILVGRDDLLQLVDRRLAEAVAGNGHALLLAGEAGIGKTQLLAAALRKATAAGFRIAKGDLSPHDRQVPLASVLDLARTMRDRPGFGDLGRELLALQVDQGGDTLGTRRHLVHDIADRVAATITEPTLLAFEDLQWADEMSLEVVGELVRLAHERPLVVLATYRLDELPPGSLHREWRSRLLNQRLAEEARLARLTREQTGLVTTLILATGLPAPREVVDAVYQRTNGIPLHVEELLAALDTEARLDGRAIRSSVVPDTIEDAVLARVNRLSDDARAVARAGAVIGRCFVPEVLAGVLDRPVADLDAPFAELVENAVLYPFDFLDRGFYDFRHQLLRDAIYATVPPGELRRFHARAGKFGGLMEGASEIHASMHFERAGLRAQAYRAALAGARAASAISSRQEAFELYARAAANLPDELPPLERAELYDAFGNAAFAIDNMPVAEEVTRLARRWYLEADRPIEAAQQLVHLAGMARRDVRPPEERRRPLDEAEAELAALPDSPERSRAIADVLEMRMYLALDALRLDEAAELLRERDRIGRAVGVADDSDRDFFQAEIDLLAGRVGDGLTTMLRVAREARDANWESTGVTAYRMAAALAVRVMDYRTAEDGLREGMRYADAIEQSYCRRIMAGTSALVAWAAGHWDRAVATAELELVERGTKRGTLSSGDALGYVAFGRGDAARARGLLEGSLAVGRTGGEVDLVLQPLWGLAEAALVAGDPGAAVTHCEEALAIAESTLERALLVPFVVTGVRAYLADRRPEAAEAWVARTAALFADWQVLAQPALDHAEGLVRLAAGSTVLARASLGRAVAGWDERGRIWERTWARLDLSACLVRAGRHAEAIPLLREIEATAEGLRSEPLLARSRELMGLARRRGGEDEPWRPLTAREFEVARLIAGGMTNGEIGEALDLSPRTVGAHVEHILAKLGATRRAEIAAWATAISPRDGGDTPRSGVVVGGVRSRG